jgi:hypothetical protein
VVADEAVLNKIQYVNMYAGIHSCRQADRHAERQACRHASRHADSQVVDSQATLKDEIMKQLLL